MTAPAYRNHGAPMPQLGVVISNQQPRDAAE